MGLCLNGVHEAGNRRLVNNIISPSVYSRNLALDAWMISNFGSAET